MGHGGKVSTVETSLEMGLLKESPSGSWREGEYCRDVFRNETTKREPKPQVGHGGKVSTVQTSLGMRLLIESPSGSWREVRIAVNPLVRT